MPVFVHAKESNNVSTEFNKSVIENIDQFFIQNPQKKIAIWSPNIKGKSRYSFSIPRNAYYLSKKHVDASDLYYLSKPIDSGLKFQEDRQKNVNLIISENNSELILSQNILSNINAGLFIKNKEKILFGLNLDKDIILSKNSLSNFSIKYDIDKHTAFSTKLVKLSNNESSEFFGNINHEFNSDNLNMGIGNTWFEMVNQIDITVGIQKQNKKVKSELYATFGDKKVRYQIGLNQIKNNSNINMFLNLKLENNLDMKKFRTNVIITSEDNDFSLRKLSLKNFRKKNLDKLWRKFLKYN